MTDDLEHIEIPDEVSWTEWYNSLSAKEREELKVQLSHAPRIAPSPGPQTAAFNSKADIIGYGGAAGGGKSALIALLAVLEHTRTVIFRADAKQVRGLIDDLVDFVGTTEGLNRQAGVFRLGDRPGHMIEWGGLASPGDEMAWRGRAHDLFCVDEATEVPEAKVRFLMTWLRTTIPGQRTRALLTFNPPGGPDDMGGGAGRWIIDYFAPWLDERHQNPAAPGELRYFAIGPNGKEQEVDSPVPQKFKIGQKEFTTKPESRTFIPAKVWDNPFLTNKDNTRYLQRLMSLEEPTRSQMLLGEFRSGVMDAEYQVIPTAWVDEAMDRWEPDGRREKMSAMGVDVARGGRDNTVFSRRHGWWWDELIRKPGSECKDGPIVAAACMEHVRDGARVCIDAIGVGASPFDFLKRAKMNPLGINANGTTHIQKIDDMMDFANLRSFLYWLARKILDPANGLMPALPKDNRLRKELIEHHYSRHTGKIQVEKKEDIYKRLRYSPDDADAFVYSCILAIDTPGGEKLLAKSALEVNRELLYGDEPTMSGMPALMGGFGNNNNHSWMGM